jgi:hypothetical protein
MCMIHQFRLTDGHLMKYPVESCKKLDLTALGVQTYLQRSLFFASRSLRMKYSTACLPNMAKCIIRTRGPVGKKTLSISIGFLNFLKKSEYVKKRRAILK